MATADGKHHALEVFNEGDWSNTEAKIGAYPKSKTLAERAAWEFVRTLGGDNPMELSVINPGFIFGPLLDSTQIGTSAQTIRDILAGANPGTAAASRSCS